MWAVLIIAAALSSCSLAVPVYRDEQQAQKIPLTPDIKIALIKDLQNEILKAATLRAVAEGIKLEQAAEDKLLEAAVETLEEEPSPERTEQLKQVETLIKRDKRAVQLLNGILGGSSGGGGAEAGASAGSDSGSILNLIGPILGSSSGGGGDGSGGDAGSGSGTILNLALPILTSSSGGGGGGGDGEAGASASAGSDSGSILNLIGPILGSSSGGSGGGGGDGSAGGGSDLSSILGISSSSSGSSGGGGGGGGGVAVTGDGQGQSLLGTIKGAKFALVGDKIQLLMRIKFGILNKILTTITNKIAFASLPPGDHGAINALRYPS